MAHFKLLIKFEPSNKLQQLNKNLKSLGFVLRKLCSRRRSKSEIPNKLNISYREKGVLSKIIIANF